MTLEEGIIHAEDVARMNHEAAKHLTDEHPTQAEKCEACAEEHRQLAEWLKDYKRLLEQEPCDDTVSRQAVIAILKDKWNMFSDANDAIQESIDTIEAIPSVTPQQKVGRWIEVIDETDSLGNKTWHHECSICGSDKSGWGTYKHCPDCGTKMEVEE